MHWDKFCTIYQNMNLDPTKQTEEVVNEELKPQLQVILDLVLDEDHRNRESRTIGEALEFIVKGKICEEICAFA